jgi:hypothetical protein
MSSAIDMVDVATGTFSNSSGIGIGVNVKPTFTTTSSGGWTAFQVNATQTSDTGSGTKRLLDVQIGGTSAFIIDANKNTVHSSAALATTATNGFMYVPTCAGVPTGTPTTYTGTVPIVFDTTDNKLYVYNGSWKGCAVA